MTRIVHQYLELTKPRIVALLVFCAVIGMFLAVPGLPPWRALVFGTLGILRESGARNPHVLLCTLRLLRSVFAQLAFARNGHPGILRNR